MHSAAFRKLEELSGKEVLVVDTGNIASWRGGRSYRWRGHVKQQFLKQEQALE